MIMTQKKFDEIYDGAHKLALHIASEKAREEARADVREIERLVMIESCVPADK